MLGGHLYESPFSKRKFISECRLIMESSSGGVTYSDLCSMPVDEFDMWRELAMAWRKKQEEANK